MFNWILSVMKIKISFFLISCLIISSCSAEQGTILVLIVTISTRISKNYQLMKLTLWRVIDSTTYFRISFPCHPTVIFPHERKKCVKLPMLYKYFGKSLMNSVRRLKIPFLFTNNTTPITRNYRLFSSVLFFSWNDAEKHRWWNCYEWKGSGKTTAYC